MFRNYKSDPFNDNNTRNVANTPKRSYNCAGYALETFSWYCPQTKQYHDYSFRSQEIAQKETTDAVNQMLKNFSGLRKVETLSEIDTKTEKAIAFRISSDGDFHYVKRGANGHWYHKMGASPHIRQMSVVEVFTLDWCDRYDGPVILFAMKKRG